MLCVSGRGIFINIKFLELIKNNSLKKSNEINFNKIKGAFIDLNGTVHPFGKFTFDSSNKHDDCFKKEISKSEWFLSIKKALNLKYNPKKAIHSQYFDWSARGLITIINSSGETDNIDKDGNKIYDENGNVEQKKIFLYMFLIPSNLTDEQRKTLLANKDRILEDINLTGGQFQAGVVYLEQDKFVNLKEIKSIDEFFDYLRLNNDVKVKKLERK